MEPVAGKAANGVEGKDGAEGVEVVTKEVEVELGVGAAG